MSDTNERIIRSHRRPRSAGLVLLLGIMLLVFGTLCGIAFLLAFMEVFI